MLRRSTLLAVLVLALAGCGSDDQSTGTTAQEPAATTTEAAGPALKIGLVTDIGGLDDRSFNFLANKGLEQAETELGVTGRVVVSKSNADYVPNLSSLAKQDYDLVIAVGFLMADAVDTVAKRYPDVNFAIIDYAQETLKSKPTNVRGLLFKEQEAGYLVGYLAGLVTKQEAGSRQVIGSVGGLKIPPVDRYIAGYQAGAKAANPAIETLNAYSQDFVDQAKCKEAALDQIGRGARVIFQVAGQCGLGALSAAQEKNVRGIGVDADQAYLGEHVLTSALKKVDVAVFQTVQAVEDGSFQGGENTVFDVASGGVGLGEVASDVPADLVSQVNEIQDRIAARAIENIPDTVR
ncbi:MAG TPA: BMP family ABC transporter substrate-binding protein [Gaiellaceae bacterium]|nr:BMP family ABC transporter substrate-binding protein [Gaiellaceae bacterium]